MTLGEKIQLSRKKRGMSQEDLANLLNVSRQAVQKWECDASIPELNKIVEISNAFEVSLDWLIKDVETNAQKVESQPTSGPEPITNGERGLSRHRYNVIKAWLIIGCILTPMSTGGAFVSALGVYALLFLSIFLITIPILICTLIGMQVATKREHLIKYGVICLIFVSLIGGILLLSTSDDQFTTGPDSVQRNRAEVKQNVNYSQPAPQPVPVIISPEQLKEEASIYLHNAYEKLEATKIKDEEKQDIKKELDKLSPEIEKIVTAEDKKAFVNKVKTAMKPVRKHKMIIAGLSSAISVVTVTGIVLAIVLPIQASKRSEAKFKYEELVGLIENYSEENDGRIITLLYHSNLSEYYNLDALELKFDNASNYVKLLKYLKVYDGNNKRVFTLLNNIQSSYKDTYTIEKEYQIVNNATSYIKYSNYLSDVTVGKTQENRHQITRMYQEANVTGYWDFSNYLKKIPIPFLIFNTSISNSEHSFSWYQGSSGELLSRDIPMPSEYDSSKKYYFYKEFDSTNNAMTFSLGENSNSRFNILKINNLTYVNGMFNCHVYLYGIQSVEYFTFYGN